MYPQPYSTRWGALHGLACSAVEALHSVRVCTGEPGPWGPAWVPPGWGGTRRSAGARAGAACEGTGWNVAAVGTRGGAIARVQATSLGCPAHWPWPVRAGELPAAVLQACGVGDSWKRPEPAIPFAASASVAAAAAAACAVAACSAGHPCPCQAGPSEPWAASDSWVRRLPAWPSAAACGFASNWLRLEVAGISLVLETLLPVAAACALVAGGTAAGFRCAQHSSFVLGIRGRPWLGLRPAAAAEVA